MSQKSVIFITPETFVPAFKRFGFLGDDSYLNCTQERIALVFWCVDHAVPPEDAATGPS